MVHIQVKNADGFDYNYDDHFDEFSTDCDDWIDYDYDDGDGDDIRAKMNTAGNVFPGCASGIVAEESVNGNANSGVAGQSANDDVNVIHIRQMKCKMTMKMTILGISDLLVKQRDDWLSIDYVMHELLVFVLCFCLLSQIAPISAVVFSMNMKPTNDGVNGFHVQKMNCTMMIAMTIVVK